MIRKVFIAFLCTILLGEAYSQKEFTSNFNNEMGPVKDLLGVNKGPADEPLGYEAAGISLVRTHDYHGAFDYEYYTDFWIFDSINQVYTGINPQFDPNSPAHYRWPDSDNQAEEITSTGANLFIRLGVSNPDNPNYPTPPLDPPLDPDGVEFMNFSELCKKTVLHFNEGWDNGYYYDVEYWEVWNEPGGLFWNGSPLQFYKMYEQVSNTLKSYDPELKVGAPGAIPATTFGVNTIYREGFLEYVQQNDLPLDFYSWHFYGSKNPYGYKMWGDSIRNILDSFGLTNAESVISEANYSLDGPELGQLNDSPKGAAYYLSSLIATQMAPVDKLLWYVGVGFFNNDTLNMPSFKPSGYALKSFQHLRDNTPIALETQGNEYVDADYDNDTLNLMALTAKSDDGNKIYGVISNLESPHQEFILKINETPWTQQDQIVFKLNIVDQNHMFDEVINVIPGQQDMSIMIPNLPSPGIALIRLEKGVTGNPDKVTDKKPQLLFSEKEPSSIRLSSDVPLEIVDLEVYDLAGKMQHFDLSQTHHDKWILTFKNIVPGMYVCQVQTLQGTFTRKLVLY